MAIIPETVEPKPLNISDFFGLNMAQSGDTQLNLGESGNMYNCYVTKDYDLSKAEGYLQTMTQVANKSIQGMWHGEIGGNFYFLFAINGHVYKFNDDFWLDFDGTAVWSTVTTDLGTLTDDKTHFFGFADKVYMLNTAEYKYYDGTTFGDVSGYVPKSAIGCSPLTGTGTPYEELNVLNGKQHITYHGDGTATYQLPETIITSLDYIYVDGILKTVTTHYTVNLTTGVITFTAGNFPITGLNNVDIYWTKGTGDRDIVYKNKFSYLYEDNRVFLYGNADAKNEIIFSPLADGIPTAEYFSANNTIPVGDSNTYVTGMKLNQSILFIYKGKQTYYAQYDTIDLDGTTTVNFPIKMINGARGNVAMGQEQILNNDPFTIDYQLIKWYPTTIENERNMEDLGYHIQKDLDDMDLSKCLTIDKQNSSEMWISNGKKVWIYHYNLVNPYTKKKDVFSRLYLEDEPTCWLLINGNLFFGTTTGRIMKISDEYLTYNGHAIDSHWEMNMYDFGANWLKKNLISSWLTLSAQPKANVEIQFITNKNAYSTPFIVNYETATFDDTDFANFTFLTNYNPQAFYVRLRAVGFTYGKVVIDNTSSTGTFVILSLTLKAEYGSEVK